MKLYLGFAKNSFQSNIAYKMNTILYTAMRLITTFIQISIWYALLGANGQTTSTAGTVTMKDMVTYTIVSAFISIIVQSDAIYIMENKIDHGEIGMDLIKPMNFKAYLFSMISGDMVYRIIFEVIPVLAVCIAVFGITPPSVQSLPFFFLSLFGGLLIYFELSYIFGITGFWYIQVWHFDRFLTSMTKLFAGMLIPFWFFPPILNTISLFLPFRSIFYTPICIFMGKATQGESVWLILQQFLWFAALCVLEKLLWKKGICKLVIQGG